MVAQLKNDQLNIFEEINHEELRGNLGVKPMLNEEFYKNAKGELLPWEEPEYLKKYA